VVEVHGLNLSWVREGLAIGGSFPMSAVPRLAQLGVRYVIDARGRSTDDAAALHAHGIDFLHQPIPGLYTATQAALERGVAWAASRLERGHKLLIHCEHGMGRSVLLGLSLLVHLGTAPRDALIELKQARPAASPSPAQLEAFIAWSVRQAKRPPSWDDLARIAYSSELTLAREAGWRAQA
jgi:hypothetical protein